MVHFRITWRPVVALLWLSGVVFDPTATPESFQREIAVTGVIPVLGTHDDNFVILQEPIKSGEFGLAMIAGVSIVKVYVVSTKPRAPLRGHRQQV